MPTQDDERQMWQMFGQQIKVARERRGMNRKQLAFALEVSPAAITALEKGRPALGITYLLRLTRFLGIPLRDLFPVDELDAMIGKLSPGQRSSLIGFLRSTFDPDCPPPSPSPC